MIKSFWYVWDLASRPWPETKCLCCIVAGCVTVTWSRHLCHASGTKSPATRAEGQLEKLEQAESQRMGCPSNRSNRSFSISNSTGMIFLLHSSSETVLPLTYHLFQNDWTILKCSLAAAFSAVLAINRHLIIHFSTCQWEVGKRRIDQPNGVVLAFARRTNYPHFCSTLHRTLCTLQISLEKIGMANGTYSISVQYPVAVRTFPWILPQTF